MITVDTSIKISVIIPTMWRASETEELLNKYENCSLIDEIIIIDNEPINKPKYLDNISKLNYYTSGENNYVNPSWNIGVDKSKNEIVCISNDDILYDVNKTFKYVFDNKYKLGVFGFNYDSLNESNSISNLKMVDPIEEKYIGNHWGCLMFVKKSNWFDIPNNMKVWYGANWIAECNKNECYALSIEDGLFTEKSSTSKDFNVNRNIDRKIFEKYKDIEIMIKKRNIHFINRGFVNYTLNYISKGITRNVFEVEENPNIIIKKLRFDNKHRYINNNMIEWDLYHRILDDKYKHLFLEPLDISVDGTYIIFNKVRLFKDRREFNTYKIFIEENFPREYKRVILDYKHYLNWGYDGNDVKIIDYAHNRLMNIIGDDYLIDLYKDKNYLDNKYGYTNYQDKNRFNILIEEKLKAKREQRNLLEEKKKRK